MHGAGRSAQALVSIYDSPSYATAVELDQRPMRADTRSIRLDYFEHLHDARVIAILLVRDE